MNDDAEIHKPVLLQEAVEFLNCRKPGIYVDCTLGLAGHSEKILEVSAPDGYLIGIDRDLEAIRIAQRRLARFQGRFEIIHGDYQMLGELVQTHLTSAPSGVLADLGASMLQFSTAERGFSFMKDGPLDMRMDRSRPGTAADLIHHADLPELTRILRDYGEEQAAYKIARRIVRERVTAAITTTAQLRDLVESVIPRRHGEKKIHPATRTFQALRIAVNRELENLDAFLFDAFDLLQQGGRLVIIAFHSLEDRTVKQVFQYLSAACRCPKRLLVCECGGKPLSKLLTRKPVTAGEEEVTDNPASRSAKLRAIEKSIDGKASRNFWTEWLAER